MPVASISEETEHVKSSVQPWKALEPMDVTESGIVTDANLVHDPKAHPPIDVTESGIVTDTKLVHD